MGKYSKIIALILITIILIGFNVYGNMASTWQEVAVDEVVEENPAIEEIEYHYKITPEPILLLPGQPNPIKEPEKNPTPIILEIYDISLLEYSLEYNGESIVEIQPNLQQAFPENYTDMEGVITFRGSNLRNSPSYGISNIQNEKLKKHWEFTTTGRSTWGGGSGWTGQPAIVRWSEGIKEIMNIEEEFKDKEGFTEVIQGSLDGNIYFLDLDSGKPCRKPIYIKNPIKGSLSIDPREYPLLYMGDGINETGKFGYRIFSLIDGEELFFINGNDTFAYRGWGAFDGSGIINSNTDTLILGGENGIFYNIKLNTEFNRENREINIGPEIIKYRYKIKGNKYQGIENSVAVYKNLAYFADNGGSIQCIDIANMKPIWALEKSDDTDATITIEVKDDIPYLYTGTEVDKQGTKGNALIRKINGLTGEIIWDKNYECLSILGERPTNGGLLATNIVGENNLDNMVIFTLARYKYLYSGLMIALDKETGEEIWKWEMPHYAWSSPVAFYNKDGKGYIIQCDSIGNMYLLEGTTGKELDKINLGSNIESSPAIFEDYVVVGTRGGKIFGVKVE